MPFKFFDNIDNFVTDDHDHRWKDGYNCELDIDKLITNTHIFEYCRSCGEVRNMRTTDKFNGKRMEEVLSFRD